MQYTGHIENGTIILDDALLLQEGARVRVEILVVDLPKSDGMPLRGTAYRYDDPFGPAIAPEDWEATQ